MKNYETPNRPGGVERALAALEPLAHEPDWDRLMYEAGRATGRTPARWLVSGLCALSLVLAGGLAVQAVRHERTIAAAASEIVQLEVKLGKRTDMQKDDQAQRYSAIESAAAEIASPATRPASELERFSYAVFRDRLLDNRLLDDRWPDDTLRNERHDATSVSDYREALDIQPADSLNYRQLQRQWLRLATPITGNAS